MGKIRIIKKNDESSPEYEDRDIHVGDIVQHFKQKYRFEKRREGNE